MIQVNKKQVVGNDPIIDAGSYRTELGLGTDSDNNAVGAEGFEEPSKILGNIMTFDPTSNRTIISTSNNINFDLYVTF